MFVITFKGMHGFGRGVKELRKRYNIYFKIYIKCRWLKLD